jgi:hypothetical protein
VYHAIVDERDVARPVRAARDGVVEALEDLPIGLPSTSVPSAGRSPKGLGAAATALGALASGLRIGSADRTLWCFALRRRFGRAAELAEDSRDPEHAPYVPCPGRDGKAPAASLCTFAALDEFADTGRVEVIELVEYHDDGCAGALLCQKRLAEIALGGHVQFAAEDQAGGAVHLAAPLDAEVPSASVTL